MQLAFSTKEATSVKSNGRTPFIAQFLKTGGQEFKLLRYFSIASLSAFAVVAILLIGFYRHKSTQTLIVLGEEKNVALARSLANSLESKVDAFLELAPQLSDEELRIHPQTAGLHQAIRQQTQGLSVAKVKLYDLNGRTVFSSDANQIGESKITSKGFLIARSGQVLSQLGHRDIIQGLHSTLKDRELLSSYIPFYQPQPQGEEEVEAVFELYTDVTLLYGQMATTQVNVAIATVALLGGLYIVLFLLVKRADRILRLQRVKLQQSEKCYRKQAEALKRAQGQLVQSEKMSSLGRLVAGIAHEINNPVSFIYGNVEHTTEYVEGLLELVQLYQQKYPDPMPEIRDRSEAIDLEFMAQDLPKCLHSMKVGAERIREIVLSLKIFARLDEQGMKAVDLHAGIDSTLLILNNQLRDAIKIIKQYDKIPPVECYPVQINQVFMNLIINAIDALLDAPNIEKKTIAIRTQFVGDSLVQIKIRDNGPGIPPHIQNKIFDPFFTTKPVGKGTGLGLSTCYEIIQKHGGQIRVSSKVGRGTEFTIALPVGQRTMLQM